MFNILSEIIDLGHEQFVKIINWLNIQYWYDDYYNYSTIRFFDNRFGTTNLYGEGPRRFGIEHDGYRFSIHLWNNIFWINRKIKLLDL